MSLIHLTAAIPLLAIRILEMARDPPSRLTSSSGEAAPWPCMLARLLWLRNCCCVCWVSVSAVSLSVLDWAAPIRDWAGCGGSMSQYRAQHVHTPLSVVPSVRVCCQPNRWTDDWPRRRPVKYWERSATMVTLLQYSSPAPCCNTDCCAINTAPGHRLNVSRVARVTTLHLGCQRWGTETTPGCVV